MGSGTPISAFCAAICALKGEILSQLSVRGRLWVIGWRDLGHFPQYPKSPDTKAPQRCLNTKLATPNPTDTIPVTLKDLINLIRLKLRDS